jgi:hypothetical protein
MNNDFTRPSLVMMRTPRPSFQPPDLGGFAHVPAHAVGPRPCPHAAALTIPRPSRPPGPSPPGRRGGRRAKLNGGPARHNDCVLADLDEMLPWSFLHSFFSAWSFRLSLPGHSFFSAWSEPPREPPSPPRHPRWSERGRALITGQGRAGVATTYACPCEAAAPCPPSQAPAPPPRWCQGGGRTRRPFPPARSIPRGGSLESVSGQADGFPTTCAAPRIPCTFRVCSTNAWKSAPLARIKCRDFQAEERWPRTALPALA